MIYAGELFSTVNFAPPVRIYIFSIKKKREGNRQTNIFLFNLYSHLQERATFTISKSNYFSTRVFAHFLCFHAEKRRQRRFVATSYHPQKKAEVSCVPTENKLQTEVMIKRDISISFQTQFRLHRFIPSLLVL